MTLTYQELRGYSAISDCDVARISMTDANHSEYFMLVEDRGGARGYWRAQRAAALEMIQMAMTEGCEPGQVLVDDEYWREAVDEHMKDLAA